MFCSSLCTVQNSYLSASLSLFFPLLTLFLPLFLYAHSIFVLNFSSCLSCFKSILFPLCLVQFSFLMLYLFFLPLCSCYLFVFISSFCFKFTIVLHFRCLSLLSLFFACSFVPFVSAFSQFRRLSLFGSFFSFLFLFRFKCIDRRCLDLFSFRGICFEKIEQQDSGLGVFTFAFQFY